MGCGNSVANDPAAREQRDKNLEIEKEIQRLRKNQGTEVKILLLGTGASGKSTIAKQMKLLFLKGFTPKEASIFTEIIFFNIIKNMKTLVMQADIFGNTLKSSNNKAANELKNMTIQLSDVELTKERGAGIASLWVDPAIVATAERANEFQLDDSAPYFFEEIGRIAVEDFEPNTKDILYVRAKTTGIVETEFIHEGLHFRMVDVGGQRNERKKWIHCFQEVTVIIFVVATSEFDQLLEEDLATNRMLESLKLFSDVINNRWFSNTNIILFLNKKDLFEKKIAKTSIKGCFPDFEGPDHDYKAAMAHVLGQFVQKNRSEDGKRTVYSHETCATDTQNVKVVFGSVADIFLSTHLNSIGFSAI